MHFVLEGEELEKYKRWHASHTCRFFDRGKATVTEDGYPSGGAIGGVITFRFTPTGLGNVIVVRCGCGHEENVTDFDSW